VFNDIPRTFVGPTAFRVEGMTGEHGERAVTTAIRAIRGVDSVAIDLPAGTVTVSAGQPVDRADIATAVEDAGYTVIA
jgi:copper chaperone CopZ